MDTQTGKLDSFRMFEAGTADARIQSMSNKTALMYATAVVLMGAIMTKVRAMFHARVPLGYQDENGFHVGVDNAKKEAGWPPVW